MQVASGSDFIDQQGFLRLFIEQMKNQDPTQPIDTGDLLNQLAQLTTVEKLGAMEDSFAAMLDLAREEQHTAQWDLAQSLVGRTVQTGSVAGLVEGAAMGQQGIELLIGGEYAPLDSIVTVSN